MKIAIDTIMVAERIRKEITRIPELASDIDHNGLLNPITVMPLDSGSFRLLAGLRRIKAVQSLGWAEIDASVLLPADADAMLQIEISENEQRDQFTFSEKMDVARLIEEIEQRKARERMFTGVKYGAPDPPALGPEGLGGESRDVVGRKIGMSGRTYSRAKYVAANAPPEMIEQLDRSETTIRQAYDKLRTEKKPAPPSAPIVPAMEPASSPKPQPAVPKPQAEASDRKPPTRTNVAKKDPYLEKLETEQAEAVRKRLEFDALPPEGKIAELHRQLKEARVRANAAETDLAREKELRKNAESHFGATIESLRNRIAAAEARIAELEGAAKEGG